MKKNLTDKQIQAYRLVSGEFEGLSTDEAAKRMSITPQAVNRLLSRAKKSCPKLFPLLTKQEADVRALLDVGWENGDIANKLQVGYSRISQIIRTTCIKRHFAIRSAIRTIRYNPSMDSQIRRKF